MRLRVSVDNALAILVGNYFLIMILGYIAAVLIPSVSIGILSSLYLVLIFSLIIFRGRLPKIDIAFLYIFVLLLSGINYLLNGMPIGFFVTGIVYNALPVILYFVPKINGEHFYEKAFSAIFFSLVVGLVFYLWGPTFYGEYLANHNYLRYATQVRTSLQGLYGVTMLGSFSACCTIYYFGKWLLSNKKKHFIQAAFSMFIVIFSGRRSAIAACLLLFIIENVIFYNTFKRNKKKQILIALMAFVGIVLAILFRGTEMLTWFQRITSVSTAVGERVGNWTLNLQFISNNLFFGKGLGSSGHIASAAGYTGVHDNSYLLILVENGILGISLFLMALIQNIYSFIRTKEKTYISYISLFIVLIFLIQAIGSNVLEFPILASLFWYSLSFCKGTEISMVKRFQSRKILVPSIK